MEFYVKLPDFIINGEMNKFTFFIFYPGLRIMSNCYVFYNVLNWMLELFCTVVKMY